MTGSLAFTLRSKRVSSIALRGVQSARKVGVWHTPEETTIERIMLQGLQIQLLPVSAGSIP